MIKNIVAIIVLLILLTSGWFYYQQMAEEERAMEEKARQEQVARAEQERLVAEERARTNCFNLEKTFVVTKDRSGAVGQDILIKPNKEGGYACEYAVAEGDMEIKNSDPEYFKGQDQNGVVTDVGTAPTGRKLRLYDLKDKSLITEKDYFGEMQIASGTLTYFGISKTAKNTCKKDEDFGVKKQVNLETFSAKETKETKCFARQ